MSDVYIVSAKRTPIGRFGGALSSYSAVDLMAHAMTAALEAGNVSGDALDFYIFGNVLRAGQGQLLPRQAAFKAGIPDTVDGMAIDMVCSSGMMSVMQAATLIRAGEADLMLAGGGESMSTAGFYLSGRARWGYKYLAGAPEQLKDILQHDGLTDPFSGEAMGLQTEKLIAEEGVTRDELDAIAAMSHERAQAATESGAFQAEIAPMTYRVKRETRMLSADEGIRPGTTTASLAKLRTAFTPDGALTAGNSSQISDGAAALLLASEAAVKAHGLTPIAKVLGGSWAAGAPYRFPEAPIPAAKRLMERRNLSIGDFALFENNEAFAVNSVLFNRMLSVDLDVLNVHGGAIALGHPIGCSGARIMVTLLHAMRQRDETMGLATICHGTGGGTAIAIEAV
ncbi:MAG: thiolase family protein [Bacteroidota bacterium]